MHWFLFGVYSRVGGFQFLFPSLLLQREFVFQEAENPKTAREPLTISHLGEAYLQLPKPPTVLLAFSWSSFSDQTDLGLLLIFFFIDLFFKSIFRLTEKLGGKYR